MYTGSLQSLSYNMLTSIAKAPLSFDSAQSDRFFQSPSFTRLSVPVRRDQYIYSQFKYVAGVPAKEGEGISVDKIRILNTLIEHLVAMQQKNIHPKISNEDTLSQEQIDSLIDQYQQQIHTVSATAQLLDYKPVLPKTGTLFNLVA